MKGLWAQVKRQRKESKRREGKEMGTPGIQRGEGRRVSAYLAVDHLHHATQQQQVVDLTKQQASTTAIYCPSMFHRLTCRAVVASTTFRYIYI